MKHLLSIPEFKVLVRAEYLYNLESHKGEYVPGLVIAVKARAGRALGFCVMLESGALFWELPISAIVVRKCDPIPLNVLQLWDCLDSEVCFESIGFLYQKRCTVKLRDGEIVPGSYRGTFDFASGPWSEMPEEAKCYHLIALDSGHLTLQPNNRILWQDQAIILKPCAPDYKVNTHIWTCETSDHTENSDKWAYKMEKSNATLLHKEEKVFHVWKEPFPGSDDLSNLTFIGRVHAESFEKACELTLRLRGFSMKDYDPINNTYKGCRFYAARIGN